MDYNGMKRFNCMACASPVSTQFRQNFIHSFTKQTFTGQLLYASFYSRCWKEQPSFTPVSEAHTACLSIWL